MFADQLTLDGTETWCPVAGERASDRLGVYEQRCVREPDHEGRCVLVWFVTHTHVETVTVSGGVL